MLLLSQLSGVMATSVRLRWRALAVGAVLAAVGLWATLRRGPGPSGALAAVGTPGMQVPACARFFLGFSTSFFDIIRAGFSLFQFLYCSFLFFGAVGFGRDHSMYLGADPLKVNPKSLICTVHDCADTLYGRSASARKAFLPNFLLPTWS